MGVRQTGQPLSIVATVAAQCTGTAEPWMPAWHQRDAVTRCHQTHYTGVTDGLRRSDGRVVGCYCRRRLVGLLLLLLFIVALVISDLHCYVKGVRMSPCRLLLMALRNCIRVWSSVVPCHAGSNASVVLQIPLFFARRIFIPFLTRNMSAIQCL